MKNLFLTLAFVFATSLSFAGINSNQTTSEMTDGSVEVTLSCGISGTLSWEGDASTSDIIDTVQYFDDLLC